ncbi:uncharacterized mitochondrial protein AtMg01250-like [Vicia villosa]|uniref:uncharacterized mitochondrial protein AtMg01250-like n=1 Tax=Vicia villosa TaxID=3911 RepID=UPI00273B87DA|nr:uncharacterized mitochondrial protein AtMg01250-like [Vicia villosa]
MGFREKWMKWMDACIFTSHVSSLVNGSAMKDFKVQKGLRQGDPLYPFLFVLAMEGLTVLVRKSVEMGDFKPFKYGEEGYVDILQFADDTVILGESSCDNLWSMKFFLRGFELLLGLKINFSKSNVFGVNIDILSWENGAFSWNSNSLFRVDIGVVSIPEAAVASAQWCLHLSMMVTVFLVQSEQDKFIWRLNTLGNF